MNILSGLFLANTTKRCSINPPSKPPGRPRSIAPTQDLQFNFELRVPYNERKFTSFPEDIFDNVKILVRLTAHVDEESERRNDSYQELVTQCLRAASISISTPSTANFAESNALRCIQLGQILFLYTMCPSMSVSGVYSQSIAVALRDCLMTDPGEVGDHVIWSPEVLCWLLVNGAIAKQAKSLRDWYIKWVIKFTRRHKLQTFDQLEALLSKTVWAEGQFGLECRKMWDEISAIPESEDM